jgi:hypothetical protein
MKSLMEYGGLTFHKIGSKLICFGSDGTALFIGLQISVATQLKSKVTPFVTAMHFMAHETNLVI